ncbi:unnamed protein product [Sphagnum compactum]
MGSPSEEDPQRRQEEEKADSSVLVMMKFDSGGEEEEEGGRSAAAKTPSKCESSPPQSYRQLKEDLPLLLKKWSSKNNTQPCQKEEVDDELRSPELQGGGGGGGGAKGDDDDHDHLLLLLLPGSSSDSKRARGGPTGGQLPPRGIEQRVRIESLDEYIKGLLISQIREPTLHVEGGLMLLLKRCLESEQQTQAGTQSGLALCSYVEHFESRLEEDLGWGCGWRNIQMMSSHLLEKDDETRDALFGGAGFVPHISALQQWLEIAWAKGFDTQGAQHFNWKIAGTHKWIGTTECAALLRSFGLRARIVDFQAVGNKRDRESLLRDKSGSCNSRQKVPDMAAEQQQLGVGTTIRRAPVDSAAGDCIGCGEYIIQGRPHFRKSSSGSGGGVGKKTDLCPTCMEQLRESTNEEDQQSIQEYMGIDETAAESSSREETGNGLPEESSSGAAGAGAGTTAAAGRDQGLAIDHRHLMDWMWNYFAGKPADTVTSSSSSASPAAATAKITMSDRSPLYFQHKGHSRTVVGIQRKQQILAADSSASNISNSSGSSAQEDFILVLDPSQRTQDIVKCLSAQTGWQRLLKRSMQTLRHPEYQLCYVEPGIVYGEELEDLKLLSSMHYTY